MQMGKKREVGGTAEQGIKQKNGINYKYSLFLQDSSTTTLPKVTEMKLHTFVS